DSPMAPPPPSPGDTPTPAAPPPPGTPAAHPVPDAPPPEYAPPEWDSSSTDSPDPTAGPRRLQPLPPEEMVAPQARPDAPPPSPPPGSGQSGGEASSTDQPGPTPGPARLKPLPQDEMAPPPYAPQTAPAPKPRSRLRVPLAWVVLAVAALGLIAVVVMMVTARTVDDGVAEPVPSSTHVTGTVTVEPTTTPPGPNACFPFQTDC